jgi:hypothetical protein
MAMEAEVEEQPPEADGDGGEVGSLRGQGAGATRPGQRTGETHGMARVVVALARWPARWKSSETGGAHREKGAARALNTTSSEHRSMPSSAREKPRGERQKDGRGGAGRGRRLERRLCDGGAGLNEGRGA